MTIEPQSSWQIDYGAETQEAMVDHLDEIRHLVDHGVLVTDPRLQAIADAPRCEHGKIDGHDAGDPYHPYASGGFVKDVCPGAPELRALLKDLAEENRL